MILDDLGACRVSAGSTFFQYVLNDIRMVVMGFNSHSVKIPSHSNKDFSFEGNVVVDVYLLSKPKVLRAMVLAPTLLMLVAMPLVQRRASK